MIHGKLGVVPETIKDVDHWIELYSRADYVLKIDRKIQYSAIKQALDEVVSQMFSKDSETEDEDL